MIHRTLVTAVTITLLATSAPARADNVLVFAAASLKNAMDEIATGFAAETSHTASVSLAGSSALARQIELGAPADVFISANVGWMDALEAAGRIAPETRHDLLGNSLVLIAHDPGAEPVEIGPELDLATLLDGGHLAMALVEAVPAGIYGKAALDSLGLWHGIAPQVAEVDNVRAALALVSTGAAPMGIVYATDAVADPGVHVIGTFPEGAHPPITYPVAALTGRDTQATRAFLAYLSSPAARAIFEAQGFTMLGK